MTMFSGLQRKAVLASAMALTALGGFTGTAARAQNTATAPASAPTVFQQDAYNLFSMTVNIVDGGLVDHQSYDLRAGLQAYFNSAQNDGQRALAVAFVAMGGLQLADQVGNEAVSQYKHWYEPTTRYVEYARDNSVKKQIVDTYAQKIVKYDGKNMTFDQAVTQLANDYIYAAYVGPHKTGNFTRFLTGYAMSYRGDNYWGKAAGEVAQSFGLRPSKATLSLVQ